MLNYDVPDCEQDSGNFNDESMEVDKEIDEHGSDNDADYALNDSESDNDDDDDDFEGDDDD